MVYMLLPGYLKLKVSLIYLQVRVRHMYPVTYEDRYPQWSNNQQTLDPKLDNLLLDIISNQLVRGTWDGGQKASRKRHPLLDDHKKKKKQKVVDAEDSPNVSTLVAY